MRGKGSFREYLQYEMDSTGEAETTPGIRRAAHQYGVLHRVLDLCTFDITQGPLRRGGLFDAIITDPPCE